MLQALEMMFYALFESSCDAKSIYMFISFLLLADDLIHVEWHIMVYKSYINVVLFHNADYELQEWRLQ